MDWMDVILHVLGALVIVLGAALLFDWSPLAAWLAAAFNAALWPAREWWQDVRRGTSLSWPFSYLVCEAQRRVDEMADSMGGLIDADSPDR